MEEHPDRSARQGKYNNNEICNDFANYLRQTAISVSRKKEDNSSDHFLAMSAMDPKMVDPSHNRQSDDIRAANLKR